MRVYISVVSHGHSALINKLCCLEKLCNEFTVVVKSNIEGDDFASLSEKNNFYWINERFGKGFGENNNIVYDYCSRNLGMGLNDYFIVLNPDVLVESSTLSDLVSEMMSCNVDFSAINLFKDKDFQVFDNSIRRFPSLKQFISSFIGLGNSSVINKSDINRTVEVEWAAGSFLGFSSEHYLSLGGFDEKYFMYCEDIDICYRSYLLGKPLMYFPKFRAVHLGKHQNRKILSRHFIWHLTSAVRFLMSKK